MITAMMIRMNAMMPSNPSTMRCGIPRMIRSSACPIDGVPPGAHVVPHVAVGGAVGQLVGQQAEVGVEADQVAQPLDHVVARIGEIAFGSLLRDQDRGEDGDAKVCEPEDPADRAREDRQHDDDREAEEDLCSVVLLWLSCVERGAVGCHGSAPLCYRSHRTPPARGCGVRA